MRRIELLDYARLAAALAVLAYHYLFSGIYGLKISLETPPPGADVAKYGYLGVHLFFMISGYVILYTARGKSAGEFVTSRAVRLYPAFWAAVLFTSCFALFLGGTRMQVTLPQVLANLTMMPAWLGYKAVDGSYWSLLVELQFYAAVLLLLVLGLQRHLGLAFILWPLLMLWAWYTGQHRVLYLGGYFPFFAAGALFAMMRERVTVPTLVSLGVCVFLAVSFACGHALKMVNRRGIDVSPVAVGVIVVAFFAFFFVMNTRWALALRLPGSRLAGGLTYPVYLIHAHVGYMLLSQFATDANRALVYPLVVAFIFLAAWAVHELVERRLAAFWHRVFWAALGRPVDRLQLAIAGGTDWVRRRLPLASVAPPAKG